VFIVLASVAVFSTIATPAEILARLFDRGAEPTVGEPMKVFVGIALVLFAGTQALASENSYWQKCQGKFDANGNCASDTKVKKKTLWCRPNPPYYQDCCDVNESDPQARCVSTGQSHGGLPVKICGSNLSGRTHCAQARPADFQLQIPK
jgi:hypothetical protein